MRSRTLVAVTSLALSLGGCSALPEADLESDSDELKIKPKDVDPQTQARITVRLPAKTVPRLEPEMVVVGPDFRKNVTFGTPLVGRAGDWKVCFAWAAPNEKCASIVTAPGDEAVLDLAEVVVEVTGPALPAAAPAPQFGPTAGKPRYNYARFVVDDLDDCWTNHPCGVVVFPGRRRVTAKGVDGAQFEAFVDVASGEKKIVTGTDTVYRPTPIAFDLRVTYEAATLPTLPTNPFGPGSNFVVFASAYEIRGDVGDDVSADWGDRSFRRAGVDRPQGVMGATEVRLRGLSCLGCTVSLDSEMGAGLYNPFFSATFVMDGSPKTIALKRLEIDDVEVTPADPPGVPYRVSGHWSLTGPRGLPIHGPTGYGVDLPSGHYTLVLEYDTREKRDQTQTFELDL